MSEKNFKYNEIVLSIGADDKLRGKKLYYKFLTSVYDIHMVAEDMNDLKLTNMHTIHGLDLIPAVVTTSSSYQPPSDWKTYTTANHDLDLLKPLFTVPTSGEYTISFDKEIQGGFTLNCECGVSKVHGANAASDMHSSWCPLYRKEG